jgi:hypothetical protein
LKYPLAQKVRKLLMISSFAYFAVVIWEVQVKSFKLDKICTSISAPSSDFALNCDTPGSLLVSNTAMHVSQSLYLCSIKMGASRAQKAEYFTKLKQLLSKYREFT